MIDSTVRGGGPAGHGPSHQSTASSSGAATPGIVGDPAATVQLDMGYRPNGDRFDAFCFNDRQSWTMEDNKYSDYLDFLPQLPTTTLAIKRPTKQNHTQSHPPDDETPRFAIKPPPPQIRNAHLALINTSH